MKPLKKLLLCALCVTTSSFMSACDHELSPTPVVPEAGTPAGVEAGTESGAEPPPDPWLEEAESL